MIKEVKFNDLSKEGGTTALSIDFKAFATMRASSECGNNVTFYDVTQEDLAKLIAESIQALIKLSDKNKEEEK